MLQATPAPGNSTKKQGFRRFIQVVAPDPDFRSVRWGSWRRDSPLCAGTAPRTPPPPQRPLAGRAAAPAQSLVSGSGTGTPVSTGTCFRAHLQETMPRTCFRVPTYRKQYKVHASGQPACRKQYKVHALGYPPAGNNTRYIHASGCPSAGNNTRYML